MNEQFPPLPPEPTRRRRGLGLKVALVGAGIAAGAITATAVGASAVTSGSGSTTSTVAAAASTSAAGTDTGKDRHGSAPVRSDEKSLSAALTAKLKAAALKAVPGGTVYRVESDSGDGVYEAHMSKADGTEVTVKFDKNGTVTGVESGMGK
jgi:uncharacterized membrane protein YkoI